jgi:hypothetical protein
MDGKTLDHLDYLDKAIGSGVFSGEMEASRFTKTDLRKRLQALVILSLIPRIWGIDEARFPVIL